VPITIQIPSINAKGDGVPLNRRCANDSYRISSHAVGAQGPRPAVQGGFFVARSASSNLMDLKEAT
jgi:hypothetical protein